jgi:hypothetical protein
MDIKDLKEEYNLNINQIRAVLQIFSSAFTIAVSGLMIGLILAAEKFPSSGPIFVIFPPVIVAWYIMMDLMGKELVLRSHYLASVELQIRKKTNLPFPCIESKIQSLIYLSWRYPILWVFIGFPFLLTYIYCSIKAYDFIILNFSKYVGAVVMVIYLICLLFSGFLMYLTGHAITKDLEALKDNLSKQIENVQQEDINNSETRK